MTIDAMLLLHQWLSPAFPVGAFSYSHGLEAAAHAGWLNNGKDVRNWLQDLLEFSAGQSDPLFLAASYHAAPQEREEIDAQAIAFQPSTERALEMVQQGEAFARTFGAVWGDAFDLRAYPVALGAAARSKDVPLDLTLSVYLQAFVSNLIGAAQRLLPVGQVEGQQILAQLTPHIQSAAARADEGDLNHLASAAFLADISAMHHETQYSRIFRS